MSWSQDNINKAIRINFFSEKGGDRTWKVRNKNKNYYAGR